MQALELLAPARNKEIGIAAIDCGADAVYIGGPAFGARKDAGNPIEDIAELCRYAHQFGVRVFVTYNTLFRNDEEQLVHEHMLLCQEAGADAFIIRDERICSWPDITTPLHASTQCAIRDAQRARHFEALGCERIVLERELSLKQIREISEAVGCEVEFFVHGALCVCYSGDCKLSEHICGRSADRGECIQACRSLYDLADDRGRILLRNKALLSLKDYNLRSRLEDLAAARVMSFKIEGRLKNISYVRNIVRDYSLALDSLVAKYPERYRRASFGSVKGGFTPDSSKTFNRGYTELFLDGKRGSWASIDAPKSMGELIGTVEQVRSGRIIIRPASKSITLRNGDGFAYLSKGGIVGFRADVCEGLSISCRGAEGLRAGTPIYRNLSTAFEKLLDAQPCRRELAVQLQLRISGDFVLEFSARCEDGRSVLSKFSADVDTAENSERAAAMLREQLSKRSGPYLFTLDRLQIETRANALPLLSASTINSMRRLLAEDLACTQPAQEAASDGTAALVGAELEAGECAPEQAPESELMRTKYCLRYELGICPRYPNPAAPRLLAKYEGGKLYLLNNGRRFALGFDCAACEMTLLEDK